MADAAPGGVLDDPARLRSVARLGLGPRADPAFDRIAVLVERLVDVPVALVTVVEADRQFLPGQVGLPAAVAQSREMALSHSFSRYVVEAGAPLAVPDVRADPVMRDSLSIRDFGSVAFAGVPLTDSDGLVLGTLAVMDREPRRWTASEITLLTDLAEICSSELRLRIAREIADEARLHAESAHDQLTLLGALTETLAATMDLDEALGRLGHVVAGRLADWCLVVLADQSGALRHVSAAHGSPARAADAEHLAEQARNNPAVALGLIRAAQLAGHLTRGELTAPVAGALGPVQADGDATGPTRADGNEAHGNTADGSRPDSNRPAGDGRPPVAVPRPRTASSEPVRPDQALREIARLTDAMTSGCYLLAPITAPMTRRIIGVVLLVNAPGHPPFTPAEEQTAVEIGRRAGLAVDNTRLYGRQRHMAEVLQHSMLPELPRIDGVDLHARYLPAEVGAAVGGDWFDAFVQPDGSVMLAVGDVSGHDIEAAATMGQVRNLVRGDAFGRGDAPGVLLAQLDRALHGLRVPAAATAVLARVRREGPSGFRVEFANAGHPPPLLLRPDGDVDIWWVPPEPLLGLIPRDDRTTHHRWVPAGSTLLLYTDGLVEHPARLIDEGIERVSAVLRGNAGLPAEELGSLLIDTARRADDIALLVVTLG